MSKLTFKLDYRGVGDLLRSQECADLVTDLAERVVAAAGEGYESETTRSGTRARAHIKPGTKEALNDAFRNNTLVKALNAAKF